MVYTNIHVYTCIYLNNITAIVITTGLICFAYNRLLSSFTPVVIVVVGLVCIRVCVIPYRRAQKFLADPVTPDPRFQLPSSHPYIYYNIQIYTRKYINVNTNPGKRHRAVFKKKIINPCRTRIPSSVCRIRLYEYPMPIFNTPTTTFIPIYYSLRICSKRSR